MRYIPIEPNLFVEHRKNYTKLLKPASIAVFNSNDIMPTNADGVMPFRQNNDLFYLCGIDQEETVLLLSPDAEDPADREILFVRETSDLIKIWEGPKLTKEQASQLSGISRVEWEKEFESIFNRLSKEAAHVYFNSNEHSRATAEVETRDDRFWKKMSTTLDSSKLQKSAPLLHNLRYVKSEEEIQQIQKACNITESAFRRVLKHMKPGQWEYEIEAEIIHEFVSNGSRGHAYQPIIASGERACILHYIENDNKLGDQELVLMDFGAEYGNYNSDLTRTIPTNGKYSSRQKDVYNAVLRAMKYACTLLVPGNTFQEYTKEVCQFIESELIQLGLLDKDAVKNQDQKQPLFRKYFMHGVSHSLGLDVHDVDNRDIPFQEGMVFTCEPGIYIPQEGIGIRIENNLVITSGAPRDLMANIPIEVEEIEDLMNA